MSLSNFIVQEIFILGYSIMPDNTCAAMEAVRQRIFMTYKNAASTCDLRREP
ncbi:hypothetical protein HMPREF3190_00134 [Umbribacter vaginalis]|nr:hypothetical protein HMPREF3190_00134 [Coriobacteriales bacterium DNF00809]